MGGYGLYVWGSYGVTLVVMAAELVLVRRRKRMALENASGLRGARNRGVQ